MQRLNTISTKASSENKESSQEVTKSFANCRNVFQAEEGRSTQQVHAWKTRSRKQLIDATESSMVCSDVECESVNLDPGL